MPAKDKSRIMKFCETAFGWQTEQLGKGLADGDWRNDEKRHPLADRSGNAGILADEEIRYCEIKESIRGM